VPDPAPNPAPAPAPPVVKVTVTYASLRAGLLEKAAKRGLGANDVAEVKRLLDSYSPLLLAFIEDLFLEPPPANSST
jgi:hypothetical protein